MSGRGWLSEDLDRLRGIYPDQPTGQVAAALGRSLPSVYNAAAKLGLAKSEKYLASPAACRLRRGDHPGRATQFQSGQVPFNKGLRRPGWASGRMQETQFKKGERRGVAAKLWKPIGTERMSKDGYLERKVNNDLPLQRRWRAAHLIAWEETNGPLPPHHAIVFRNGDKSDGRIGNLEIITRAELMQRNTIHKLHPELKQTIRLVASVGRAIRKRTKTDAEKSTGRPS